MLYWVETRWGWYSCKKKKKEEERLGENCGTNVVCGFYKYKGHSKKNCYKIVGYPPNFKTKKKGYGGTNIGAYNAFSES